MKLMQYRTVSSIDILNDGKEYAVIQSSTVNLLKAKYRRYVLFTREMCISNLANSQNKVEV